MSNYKNFTIGVAPTRRDTFPPAEHAINRKEAVLSRLRKVFGKIDNLDVVDIESINSEGILVEHEDILKTIKLFKEREVDALFMPHLNFGQEEAVGRLAAALNVPFLLWGPRDPSPAPNVPNRELDAQCGLFASSKALRRYGVPFTYIENCWLDSPVLDKGIDDFIRTASAVKAFRKVCNEPFRRSTKGSFDGNFLLPQSTECSIMWAMPVLSAGGVRNEKQKTLLSSSQER